MESTFYQQLIANANFGYAHHKALLDANGEVVNYIFVEVNRAFEELTGLSMDRLVGRKVTEVLKDVTDDVLEWLDCYWEVAQHGIAQNFEQYSKPLDRWYSVQVSLSKEHHFTTIFTDITKIKKAEIAIQNANHRIQLQRSAVVELLLNKAIIEGELDEASNFITKLIANTLEVQRVGIWLFKPEQKRVDCISLYDLKERKFLPMHSLYVDAFQHFFKLLAKDAHIRAENVFNEERLKPFIEYYRENNINSIINTAIVVNGKIEGVFTLEHTDTIRKWEPDEESFCSTASTVVTQILLNRARNYAEIELRESEQRFRDVVDTMGETVFEIDLDLKLMYISSKINDILGYSSEELKDKKLIDFVHPEDIENITNCVAKCIEEQCIQRAIDHRMIRYDGSDVWVSFSGAPIFDKLGKLVGIRGTLEDITMQKQAQGEMLKRQAAEAANRAKSEFLANMSHEIRTPLNAVIGFTDLLVNTTLDNVQQQYVQNANTSAHALLGIINDILDFSKIEAGKLELDVNRVDIIEMLEQAVDIIKYAAAQKHLELLLNISPYLPRYAYVDGLRLKQILVNLLSNAVKFTEQGEVELKVDFEPLADNNGRYLFSVRDTGIGISKEQQSKLFTAFSQADTSTTRKFGGTGLGLTISNKLAEKMGSIIQINSKANQGSVFSLEIHTNYEFGQKEDYQPIAFIQKILIVDDNQNNRLILKQLLKTWQIDAIEAKDGIDALKVLEKAHKDIQAIIIDYNMPNMNGLETIAEIRKLYRQYLNPYNIILLHSSSDDQEIYNTCRNYNIRHKLVKPIKIEKLYETLTKLKLDCKENCEGQKKEIKSSIVPSTVITELEHLKPVILIAEDVAINRLLIRKLISQMIPTATIIEAEDGLQALEKVKSMHLDLVFMDLQMPSLDGYFCTKAIRKYEAEQQRKALPIIALTAGAIQEDKKHCFDAGMNGFLTKPIDKQAVIDTLKSFLLA